MSKKTKQTESTESDYQKRLNHEKKVEKINSKLLQMRYADLQRACITRGMDFDLMASSDIGKLQSWVINNWDNIENTQLLHDFDQWRADYLKGMGKTDEPFVRLGYVGETDPETGDIEILKPKKVRESNTKREKDDGMGIYKGTKKALSYQCVKEGKTVEETITIVKAAFPEAIDKSIKIWMKKAKEKLAAENV